MNILLNILLIFPGFIVAFIIFYHYKCKIRQIELKNKIHFYVARERDGSLWIHLGKPIQRKNDFVDVHGSILPSNNFRKYGLNRRDYANLKWEDGPVEVFITMKE